MGGLGKEREVHWNPSQPGQDCASNQILIISLPTGQGLQTILYIYSMFSTKASFVKCVAFALSKLDAHAGDVSE